MSRERFEKLWPPGKGVAWDDDAKEYLPTAYLFSDDALRQQGRYEGHQSRQPEIDELVGALEWIASNETARDCFDGADEIEKIKARATAALVAYRGKEGKS